VLVFPRARTCNAFIYLQYTVCCNKSCRESGASEQNMIFSSKMRYFGKWLLGNCADRCTAGDRSISTTCRHSLGGPHRRSMMIDWRSTPAPLHVVRELTQKRVWFAESLISATADEVQRLIKKARECAESLDKVRHALCGRNAEESHNSLFIAAFGTGRQ
jgi:hypothetical protein